MSTHQPLMGRLASRWFPEYVVTDAFRLLLDDRNARSAFLRLVGDAAAVDLSAVTAFERERPIANGQLDLQGVDSQGRPRLIIEAKFGHTMGDRQMRWYLSHQVAALTGSGHTDDVDGVLLLLVPQPRLADAAAIMAHLACSQSRPSTDPKPKVVPIGLSWERCLDTIMNAVSTQNTGPVSVAADTAQLRALCATLSADVAPLADVPQSEQYAHLRHVVIDLLKDRLPGIPIKLTKDRDYSVFRYYALPGDDASVYSVGLSSAYRTEDDDTDVWLRFHKDTGNFTGIQRRIHRSPLFEKSRPYRGHLWFPLFVEPDLPSPDVVERLAVQVGNIVATAAPLSNPGSPGAAAEVPDVPEEDVLGRLLEPSLSNQQNPTPSACAALNGRRLDASVGLARR